MRIIYTVLLALINMSLVAQITTVSSDFNYLVYNEFVKQQLQTTLRAAPDTLDLPFFDDFAYPGPYPDQNSWIDNNVFINNSIGENPPSVGMASFDGLSSGGTPYGGLSGKADYLTSTFLDLSSFSADDNVYLSFYIQAGGNGDSPEVNDSLLVEFKNSSEEWEKIEAYSKEDVVGGFQFKAIPVLNDDYFHQGFQFRFVNIAEYSFEDFWHLDYVKLVPNGSDVAFSQDIAFVQEPSNFLRNYNSMPWHQFIENVQGELNDEMDISLFNHFDETNSAEPSSFSLIESNTGLSVIDEPELLKLDGSVNQKDVPSNQLVEYTNPLPAFANAIDNPAFDNEDVLEFIFSYEFEQNEETNLTSANNKVSRKTIFDNYLAYDDGTGESNLAAQGAGTQLAVKFTTNVGDSLKAVQFHIPHLNGNVENQFFNLKIWIDDLESDPIFDRDLLRPFYVDNVFDTLQGFTSYRLEDFAGVEQALFIPKGDFYVGWQQVNDENENAIPLGYDLNSPNGFDKIFQNLGGGWEPLASFNKKGSLMIRPVLGNEPAINTEVIEVEEELAEDFLLSPNPNNGQISLRLKEGDIHSYSISVHDMLGKIAFYQREAKENITLGLPNGYYMVSLQNRASRLTYTKKIIINQ